MCSSDLIEKIILHFGAVVQAFFTLGAYFGETPDSAAVRRSSFCHFHKPEGAAPRRGGVLRGQRQGSALHPRLCGGHQRALPSGLPLGLCPPDPEMLAHLCFACGRDGGLGAVRLADTVQTDLPKGGQAGRFSAEFMQT